MGEYKRNNLINVGIERFYLNLFAILAYLYVDIFIYEFKW